MARSTQLNVDQDVSPGLRDKIQRALKPLAGGDLSEGLTSLAEALGYPVARAFDEYPRMTSTEFVETLQAPNADTQSEREFLDKVGSVDLVFQVTDQVIQGLGHSQQEMLQESGPVDIDPTNRSFFFAAVEMKGNTYPRGAYASVAREINKRVSVATLVAIRTSDGKVTLAFADRRRHMRQHNRRVLGNVSVLREIDCAQPHSAHVRILAKLLIDDRVEWIKKNGKTRNFDGMLAAWLDVLDTQELNKSFYRGLFKWFQRAVKDCRFPTKEKKVQSSEEHVIRLISRMLFIWFIRENGLVPDDLFEVITAKRLIKDFDPERGDSYYRVFLQNLFFATLNAPIADRGFRDVIGKNQAFNPQHRVFGKWRYEREINPESKEELSSLLNLVPFVNGGLFDCLDSEDSTTEGGWRIDCFSDNPKHSGLLSVPNNLFFDEDGLFALFRAYRFTVEEQTPNEREVALDPELLGNVFENLLAAQNPESSGDARKSTGSYYTPRAVVEYMVDEALVEALVRKCCPEGGDAEWWKDRVSYLLDFDDADDADELFSDEEKRRVINAISTLKVLDPAVGSGAFPMGVLQKLTQVLKRLDPDGSLWNQRQIQIAAGRIGDRGTLKGRESVEIAMQDVLETFDSRGGPDFARKRMLIKNTLFGVDKQVAATQIAKLRVFITLAVEQQIDRNDKKNNYGIRPLPNLETRFVAADSVRKLPAETQMQLGQGDLEKIRETERKLRENREAQFSAQLRKDKMRLAKRDRKLRTELTVALKKADFGDTAAELVAQWDPFSQIEVAPWFDPHFMFGVDDGFDVVIGNPPYISVLNLPSETRKYLLENYSTCIKRTDIYVAFLDRAVEEFVSERGVVVLIMPLPFTVQQYAEVMRRKLVSCHSLLSVLSADDVRIFENAAVYNCIVVAAESPSGGSTEVRIAGSVADFAERSFRVGAVDPKRFLGLKDARFDTHPRLETIIRIGQQMKESSSPLSKICYVAYGARLNHKDKSLRRYKGRYISCLQHPGYKPLHEGRDIQRYKCSPSAYVNYVPTDHVNPMFPELFSLPSIVTSAIPGDRIRFAFNAECIFNTQTVVNAVRWDRLENVDYKPMRRKSNSVDADFARSYREKSLTAVLNSTAVNWYFMRLLSDNLHVLPGDVMVLPIPETLLDRQDELCDMTDLMMSDAKPEDKAECDTRIDDLVYALYGLDSDDISFIKSTSEA